LKQWKPKVVLRDRMSNLGLMNVPLGLPFNFTIAVDGNCM